MTASCKLYLDECLPHQVADALKLVGFPIECALSMGMIGWQDEDLLPELVRLGLTWITKDEEARRMHLASSELRTKLHAIWVRGFDRKSEPMTLRGFHHLMTNCLHRAEGQIEHARGALWFELYFNGERPTLAPLDRQGVFRRLKRRQRRASR